MITYKGPRWAEYWADEDNRLKENMRRVAKALDKIGVSAVEVSFYGSGDSGDVDGCSYVPYEHGAVAAETNVTILAVEGVANMDGSHHQIVVEQTVSLDQFFYDYASHWANSCGTDWWNNEGGHGQVRLTKHGDKWLLDGEACYYTQESHVDETLEVEL